MNEARSNSVALPRVKIVAITNDTVATFASLAYSMKSEPLSRVAMGLIVGTGCNATIPMKLEALNPSKRNYYLLSNELRPREDEVVINTEWTINGAAGPLRDLDLITRWDIMLDKATDAPGFQPFEYVVAGRYLGELVRLVLADWFKCGLGIIEASLPHLLGQRNALTTAFLATIVAPAEDPSVLATYLNSNLESAAVGNRTWTAEFSEALHRIAKVVEGRSAAMIAAAVVGLLASTWELSLDGIEDDNPLVSSKTAPQSWTLNLLLHTLAA